MKKLPKMNFKKYFVYSALGLAVFSCTPRQDINYMQDIENITLDNSIKNSRTTLQPGDQLIISVTAKDLDVVKPFNQSYSSSSEVVRYSNPSSNSVPQPSPVVGQTYIVDTDYNIVFPQIGKVNTKDENIESLRSKLTDLVGEYVKNPVIDARLINFKVSVMGEVARPGVYVVPEGNATVLAALGLAGDLTTYGIRKNVLIVRTVDGQITHHRIDLTSAQFINSPYYYLKQNDMIYVQPNENREKAARVDPNTGLYISVASVIASLVIGVLALTKN